MYHPLFTNPNDGSIFASSSKQGGQTKNENSKCMQGNKKKPVVVGIGELLWDMLPTGHKVGGAPVNFVYHAAHLGTESYAISAVGNDELGKAILQELDANGIQHLIEKVAYPTGSAHVILNDGIPEYRMTERVAWDHIIPTADAVDLAERADAICFGTLAQRSIQSREAIQAILSFVPDNAYRVFDVNLRQTYYTKELIDESLYLANVLKANIYEWQIIRQCFALEGSDAEAATWMMDKYNLRMVVLTAGAAYSSVFTPEQHSTLASKQVQVVDTVGAGDAFTGALIVSLLQGKSLLAAHQMAVDTAAWVCTQEGAWPSYEQHNRLCLVHR